MSSVTSSVKMSSPLHCPKMTSWQRAISHSQYIRSLTPFRDMCQETQYPLYVKCINTFCICYNRRDSPSICPLGMLSEVPTGIIQRATNRCNVAHRNFNSLETSQPWAGSSTTPFVADELTDPLSTRKHDTYKKTSKIFSFHPGH
jgi:hypothetical protein